MPTKLHWSQTGAPMINKHMMKKYGLLKKCQHCQNEFVTKLRFLDYCSTPCKNPINRKGNTPWNKGLQFTEEQKSKLNLSGLTKGHGWNKGLSNPHQKEKWTGKNNPNWEGKLNNLRPKKLIDDDFVKYKKECKKITYRTVYRLRKENLMPVTGKRKNDLQVDHIIPFRQGYELGISPEVMGHSCNLQFITGEENRKKWDIFQDTHIIQQVLENYNGLLR